MVKSPLLLEQDAAASAVLEVLASSPIMSSKALFRMECLLLDILPVVYGHYRTLVH